MNNAILDKQLVVTTITSVVSGLIFISAVLIAVLFMLDVFITIISFGDPLHQGGNIDLVWKSFIPLVILYLIVPTIASFITGAAITLISKQVRSGWIYAIGMGLGLIIYCFFHFFTMVIVFEITNELMGFSWMILSFPIVAFFSVIIGLICVAINVKMNRKMYEKMQGQQAFSQ